MHGDLRRVYVWISGCSQLGIISAVNWFGSVASSGLRPQPEPDPVKVWAGGQGEIVTNAVCICSLIRFPKSAVQTLLVYQTDTITFYAHAELPVPALSKGWHWNAFKLGLYYLCSLKPGIIVSRQCGKWVKEYKCHLCRLLIRPLCNFLVQISVWGMRTLAAFKAGVLLYFHGLVQAYY